MLSRLKLTVCVGALTVPFIAVAANPSLAASLGVDVWNLPGLRDETETSVERSENLDSENVEIRRRIDAKESLINDLIDGRRSLGDVASQFSVLNDGYRHHLTVIRKLYPGASDEEKMVWNVIDFVPHRMTHLPAWNRLAVMCRLQTELQALLAAFAANRSN